MTMPDERTRAITSARKFLRDLLDPKKTPRVPRYIRDQAHRVLRHFPGDYDIHKVAKSNPDVFGKIESEESDD